MTLVHAATTVGMPFNVAELTHPGCERWRIGCSPCRVRSLVGASGRHHDGGVKYGSTVLAAATAIAATLASEGAARAECPTTPDDAVCRPWSAMLLPTAFAAVYAPHGMDGAFYGGGLEAVLLAWSDNSDAYGPSQGRLRIDVAYLTSSAQGSAMTTGGMAMYR